MGNLLELKAITSAKEYLMLWGCVCRTLGLKDLGIEMNIDVKNIQSVKDTNQDNPCIAQSNQTLRRCS